MVSRLVKMKFGHKAHLKLGISYTPARDTFISHVKKLYGGTLRYASGRGKWGSYQRGLWSDHFVKWTVESTYVEWVHPWHCREPLTHNEIVRHLCEITLLLASRLEESQAKDAIWLFYASVCTCLLPVSLVPGSAGLGGRYGLFLWLVSSLKLALSRFAQKIRNLREGPLLAFFWCCGFFWFERVD